MANRSSEHIKAQKDGKQIDAYMCNFCLNQFKGNHGHHIILYSEGGRASIENIITLCPKCHREYHSGKLQLDIVRF